ncbi:hypothetical protein, partial [Asticcacaulis sp.]|uniref:hypothetical protein n=1 Tax=Asticcacaulis sp. TaxID=1872648 RepID=UPI002D14DF0A
PVRFTGSLVFRPWQQSLIDMVKGPPDDRSISLVIDPIGGNGKSFLSMYLKVHHNCSTVPVNMRTGLDIMRFVYCIPTSSCYIVDLPRAVNKNQLQDMASCLEVIKSGMAYDDRYTYKEKLFEPPHIIIFSNHSLDTSLFSQDRWKIFNIVDSKLVRL